MHYMLKKRKLSIVSNRKEIVLNENVSHVIDNPDYLYYVETHDNQERSTLYLYDGNVTCISDNVKSFKKSLDNQYIFFLEDERLFVLEYKSKNMIDNNIYNYSLLYPKFGGSYRLLYTKAEKHICLPNSENLFIYNSIDKKSINIAKDVISYHFFMRDEIILKLIYFKSYYPCDQDQYNFGELCIYEDNKELITFKNAYNNYKISQYNNKLKLLYMTYRNDKQNEFSAYLYYQDIGIKYLFNIDRYCIESNQDNFDNITVAGLESTISSPISQENYIIFINIGKMNYYNEKTNKLKKFDNVCHYKIAPNGEIVYCKYNDGKFDIYNYDPINDTDVLVEKESIDFKQSIDRRNSSAFPKVIIPSEMITFVFTNNESKAYYLAKEISKSALSVSKIQNEFQDDITENYKVSFDARQNEEIQLSKYVLSRNKCATVNIYNYNIIDICSDCCTLGHTPNLDGLHSFKSHKLRNLIDLINMTRPIYPGEYIRNYNLAITIIDKIIEKNQFSYEFEAFDYLYDKYILKLCDIYKSQISFSNNQLIPSESIKMKLELIFGDLTANGNIPVKWTSEADMYKLIKSVFPDAIFQYRDKWLDKQSLDVFVPSKKIGFEYQGKQHYSPVSFFGGNDAFIKRLTLDEEKKEKCETNNITLITWNFDEPVSKPILVQKLNRIDFSKQELKHLG